VSSPSISVRNWGAGKVPGLLAALALVPDPRRPRGRRYRLVYVLAVAAGTRNPGGQRPGSADESVTPYADRGLVTREQWNGIIRGATGELWLYGMAEYGYATDADVPGILQRATARGCRVRILLLNPGSAVSAAIDQDEGHAPGTLAARTRAALARFAAMRCRCGPGMRIRVYDGHPTVSVVRGDDAMLGAIRGDGHRPAVPVIVRPPPVRHAQAPLVPGARGGVLLGDQDERDREHHTAQPMHLRMADREPACG